MLTVARGKRGKIAEEKKKGGRRITKGETAAERKGEEKAEEGGNEGRKGSNAEGDI